MQEMLDFFKNFKPLAKTDAVDIDNNVFKLHSKFTVMLLVIFSVLVTSKQYFGDPIDCIYETGLDRQVIETYCWIFGTYTVKKTINYASVSIGEAAYPGVAANPIKKAEETLNPNPQDEIITQKYYQFVCIVFVMQALAFYIPRYLWKTWEGGRIAFLVKDLCGPIISEEWNRDRKRTLIDYFVSQIYTYQHNVFAIRFIFCELVNFINVIVQIVLLDLFLGGQFYGYGLAVAFFSENETVPMAAAFPKMTKCTFFVFGSTGQIQKRDALCILPLNILNEKLFVILWFWFMILAAVSGLNLVYRALVVLVPQVRMYLLMAQVRYANKLYFVAIANKFQIGDWFMLYQIGKNLNPLVYRDFIRDLGAQINAAK